MPDGKNTIQLETITVEKDVGVYVTNYLKPTEQGCKESPVSTGNDKKGNSRLLTRKILK